MRKNILRFIFLTVSLVVTTFASDAQKPKEAPSFEKDVLPLFKKYCFKCHGEKKQQAELRLDNLEWLNKGSENGPVYKAGDAKNSLLYELIATDGDDIMPPKGRPMKSKEIKIVKTWIDSLKKAEAKKK